MERAPVRQLIRGFRASAARRQTVACLLLLLIAHALFVHFTHHHAGRGHDLTSAPVASQDTHTPDEHLPQAQSEHCVACHLQRSYLTLEHAPVVALIFTPADAGWESLPFDPHQAGAFLSAAGRAPPLS